MAEQITNYQCPSCTAPLRFDGASQKLVCDYCGVSYTVQEIESLYAAKDEAAAQNWDNSNMQDDWAKEGDDVRVYNCPACGAQLICDETTAASSCPYCGNPTIVPGQLHGEWKPDYVIPFKLDKEAAVAALKKHYQGKKLLPKAFTDENHIQKLQGVYVPFWLFDGVAEADLRFTGTRTDVRREGDYRVTETRHYNLQRSGTITMENIPVDGSSKMPDELMDSIEPFDYSELKPFSNAYLPGFMADKYDVSADESFKRADVRAQATIVSSLESTCFGYETVTRTGGIEGLQRGPVKYALFPVWVLATQWKDQNFLFAMNGQTGKLVGDLPIDKGRYWKFFGIVTGIVTAAAAVLGCLLL